MNHDNLRRSLKANQFYYAQMYKAMRPAHEKIRLEQKQVLVGLYSEVAKMESHLRTLEAEFGYKYSDDQPRVPAGSPDGGQWTSGGGGDASNNNDTSQPNLGDAIQSLQDNAEPTSQNQCATYVREALNAGGFDVKPIADAKNYGPELQSAGFAPVSTWSQQFDASNLPASGYLPGYTPKAGDVAVIQPYAGGNPSGHMTMYDGSNWISDFNQRGIWPGQGYRDNKPDYTIYRYPN